MGLKQKKHVERVQYVFLGRQVSVHRTTARNVCWCVGAAANPDTMVSTSSAPCRWGAPPCSQCAPTLATSAVTAVAVWMESGGPTGWRPVPECFGPTAACRWSLPVHRAVERCSSPAGLRRYCKRLSYRGLQTTPCRCGAERACENCTRLRLIWHDFRSWGDCPVTFRVTLQCTSQVANSRRYRQFSQRQWTASGLWCRIRRPRICRSSAVGHWAETGECDAPIATGVAHSMVCVCVCVCLGHTGELCKNRW